MGLGLVVAVLIDTDLPALLETCALIAATEDHTLESFLEACARAYCEVHNTRLVECTVEARVEDKPESN